MSENATRTVSVSYTHLDVYKRQVKWLLNFALRRGLVLLIPPPPKLRPCLDVYIFMQLFFYKLYIKQVILRTNRFKSFQWDRGATGSKKSWKRAIVEKTFVGLWINIRCVGTENYILTHLSHRIYVHTGEKSVSYTHLDVYKRQLLPYLTKEEIVYNLNTTFWNCCKVSKLEFR